MAVNRERQIFLIPLELCHELHMCVQVKTVTVCRKYSKISSSFVLKHSGNYHLTQPTSPTPPWPPTQHRRGTGKGENHSKSGHIDESFFGTFSVLVMCVELGDEVHRGFNIKLDGILYYRQKNCDFVDLTKDSTRLGTCLRLGPYD